MEHEVVIKLVTDNRGAVRVRLTDVARLSVIVVIFLCWGVGAGLLILTPWVQPWAVHFGAFLVAFGLLVEVGVWRAATKNTGLALLASTRGRVKAFRDHASEAEIDDGLISEFARRVPRGDA